MQGNHSAPSSRCELQCQRSPLRLAARATSPAKGGGGLGGGWHQRQKRRQTGKGVRPPAARRFAVFGYTMSNIKTDCEFGSSIVGIFSSIIKIIFLYERMALSLACHPGAGASAPEPGTQERRAGRLVVQPVHCGTLAVTVVADLRGLGAASLFMTSNTHQHHLTRGVFLGPGFGR
jgi:hypothetical protein